MKRYTVRVGIVALASALALTLLLAGARATTAAEAIQPPGEVSETAPSVETPPAPTEEAHRPKPARERSSKSRKPSNELVAIGSDGNVGAGQVVSEVVVVNGNSVVEGDVAGDVVVVFGKLKVTGKVSGDVVVVLGEAEIDGRVSGDTSLVLSRSRFGPSANVDGDVISVGATPDIDVGARLREVPEVVSLGPLMGYFEGAKNYLLQGVLFLRPFPPRIGWVWVVAGGFLMLHVLLALILPRPLGECMDLVRQQPIRSFLVGLLTCILIGPVSLLLSFTVLAPILIWLVFFALCVFGRVTVYGAVGAAIGRSAGAAILATPVIAVVAGSVLLYLAYMVPLLGLLAYGLVLPLGVGAVLMRVFEAVRRDRPTAKGTQRPDGMAVANALVSGAPGPATHATTEAGRAEFGTSEPATEPVRATQTPPRMEEPSRVIPLGTVEALSLPRVGFWPRLGATLIDMILVGVINAVTFQTAESFWVLVALFHVAMWSWRGTTVGGAVLNLRLVRLDGRPIDWQTAVVRALGAVVSLVPFGLGFFWASWDAESQSWHDRIAGTTLVKSDRRVTLV